MDGFTRTITFLTCSTNNRASTVLQSFLQAIEQFGVPARIRTDKGCENQQIARFMLNVRDINNPNIRIPSVFAKTANTTAGGNNEAQEGGGDFIYMDNNGDNVVLFPSVVVGRSVHNERIERLWNDIFKDFTQFYKDLFEYIEIRFQIDFSSNLIAKYCLHYFFLLRINQSLERCIKAWNLHPLRTERHVSPYQLHFFHQAKSFSQHLEAFIHIPLARTQFNIDFMNGSDIYMMMETIWSLQQQKRKMAITVTSLKMWKKWMTMKMIMVCGMMKLLQ